MKKDRDTDHYLQGRKIAEEAMNTAHEEIQEWSSFDDYLVNNKYSHQIVDLLTSSEKLSAIKESYDPSKKSESVNRLQHAILHRKKRSQQRKVLFSALSTTAALFILVFVVFYQNNSQEKPLTSYNVSAPTLILNEGEEINLVTDSIQINNKQLLVNKQNGSTLTYNKRNDEGKVITPRYNTMIIPSKFTYNLILEDNTEVFLNSNSKLRFPELFCGECREVYLEGEAYFKVSKSEIPFIVTIGGMDVQVYGTEFNVRSSSNDVTEMVLVSGSVGIRPHGKIGREVMILPNELCLFNRVTERVTVENVDVADYIAWKEQKFRYNNQPIKRLLDDLSSWYGITLKSSKEKENILVTMNFNRTEHFEDVIEFIEAILECKIVNEGKEVYMIQ